jgi:hypothetical protein
MQIQGLLILNILSILVNQSAVFSLFSWRL